VRLPQMMLRMHYKTLITILSTFQRTRKIKYWKHANGVLKSKKKKWINIKSKNTVTRCCFQYTWSRRQIIISINLNVIMIIYYARGQWTLYIYKVSIAEAETFHNILVILRTRQPSRFVSANPVIIGLSIIKKK